MNPLFFFSSLFNIPPLLCVFVVYSDADGLVYRALHSGKL